MPSRIINSCAAVISDLHVGSPENEKLEDFDRDHDFERLLDEVIPSKANGRKATLVINGDFIDFPQILPELGKNSPKPNLGTTEAESCRRVEKAIAGHPRVFAAMRRFIAAGNQVVIVPGNHDVDLFFDGVRRAIAGAMDHPSSPSLEFAMEGVIHQGKLHIEHGHQQTRENGFQHWPGGHGPSQQPIRVGPDGVRRVERPWGTWFMDVLYNDVEALYPFVNKVHPTLALVTIAARLLRAKTGGVTPVIEELDAMAAVAGAVAAAGLSPVNQRELKRARELWKSECDVVVFGHTHDRQDVTKSKGGRQLRLVDTGSWIPRITVNPWDPPSLEELKSAKPEHSIHYAWLELGAEVTATLETLVSGSG